MDREHARVREDARGEEAVSPVIGVVLLVAITVILGGVVGATVMGMGGSVQEDVRAGVNVEFDEANGEVDVTYVTSQNADHINVTLRTGSVEAKAVLNGPGSRVIARSGQKLAVVGDAEIPNGCDWHQRADVGGGGAGAGGGGGAAPTMLLPIPLRLSWGVPVSAGSSASVGGPGGGPGGAPGQPVLRGCTASPPADSRNYAPERGDRIDIVVTGIKGESRTVILTRQGQI